jgi:aminopeptidase
MELPENHLWVGGAEKSAEGIEFIANMPTEEIFSMPKRDGVNGVVYSSKPLNYAGNLIENFSLTFKDGKIVDFKAEKGHDALKKLIETDEGSHYLGEVALVPFDSPISNSGTIFFNTLYDENASCHFAIGRAYSLCIEGGDKMTDEELLKAGANDSLTHVDFMLGTEDLDIVGTTHDGQSVQIFKNGNWAF